MHSLERCINNYWDATFMLHKTCCNLTCPGLGPRVMLMGQDCKSFWIVTCSQSFVCAKELKRCECSYPLHG
ncbi:hypothetical protein L1887_22568 [Cichorium endivia]|nr:hypothetical protein L1887_22568 [Cichorium endivia]